jgi:hypothetical protein
VVDGWHGGGDWDYPGGSSIGYPGNEGCVGGADKDH